MSLRSFIRAFVVVLLAGGAAAGCAYQHESERLVPTAPSGTGASTLPGAHLTSFVGANWAAASIAGLPILSSCSNLQWTVTAQTANSVTGNVSAACSGGATVTAALTGQMSSSSRIDLTATGSAVVGGATCAFNLTGIATSASASTTRVEYSGTTCLGPVSGTELLDRSLPQIP